MLKNTIIKEAPNDAPDEMPKINGLTSGFLKMDCKTAPETERLIPTKITSNILGSLTCSKIVSSISDQVFLIENILCSNILTLVVTFIS